MLRTAGRLLKGRRGLGIRFERGGENFYGLTVSVLSKTCVRSQYLAGFYMRAKLSDFWWKK